MISQRTIDDIMSAVDIVDVVRDFLPLKRAGRSWVGKCPFHDDHSPSMHVTPHLGIYKCFVCDAKGNAINFLMNHEKLTYPEALRYLAKKYGIDVEEDVKKLSPEQEALQSEREALLNVNAYAEKYFIEQLTETEEGRSIGLTYLRDKRGFRDETIKKFKLGYCPDDWESFTKTAQENGYKVEDLLTLGLSKKSERGKVYDFYHGRVIFPIHNTIGKAIGFGGRVMQKDVKGPKYYNSPENPIYHKSDVLYGYFFAKKEIRRLNNVYLVEGYTDVISMSEAGVENVVASSGTALTEGQIRLVQSQTNNITVLYDGDMAGIKASLRGINMLLAAGLNVRAVLLPDGEDPDSFAKAHRDSELQQYLQENSVSIIQFIFNVLSKEAGDDTQKRFEMTGHLLDTISEEKDPLKQSFYIEECARLTGRPEDVLRAELQKIVWKKLNQNARRPAVPNAQTATQPTQQPLPAVNTGQAAPRQTVPEPSHDYQTEYNIIRFLLKYGDLETHLLHTDEAGNTKLEDMRVDQYIFNAFHDEEFLFQDPVLQKIYDEYSQIAAKEKDFEKVQHAFAQSQDNDVQDVVIPILMEEEPEYSPSWESRFELQTSRVHTDIESLNKELTGCVIFFKLNKLEEQKKLLTKELGMGHEPAIERDILQRLSKINELYKNLSEQIRFVMHSL